MRKFRVTHPDGGAVEVDAIDAFEAFDQAAAEYGYSDYAEMIQACDWHDDEGMRDLDADLLSKAKRVADAMAAYGVTAKQVMPHLIEAHRATIVRRIMLVQNARTTTGLVVYVEHIGDE